MYRKTPSNSSNEIRFLSKLKRVFKLNLSSPRSNIRLILGKYPIQVFSIMVVTLLISVIIAFKASRIRKDNPVSLPNVPTLNISSGTNQIIDTYALINEVTIIQGRLQKFARKDTLNRKDSLEIQGSLKRLDEIQKMVKPILKPKQ